MEKYLQEIIQYYQRNLETYFPQEEMGIADRTLFNKAILDVACQFDKKHPTVCGNLREALNIMKSYGFNVNTNIEKRS
jgi:hypothetical protein